MRFKDFLHLSELTTKIDSLLENGDMRIFDKDELLKQLSEISKILNYFIHHGLNNENDIDRFEKFILKLEKQLPELANSMEIIKDSINVIKHSDGVGFNGKRHFSTPIINA